MRNLVSGLYSRLKRFLTIKIIVKKSIHSGIIFQLYKNNYIFWYNYSTY